ncbi:Hypothetical predicted protein [Mytilus galloprovincialis]|uniref:NACHT domain-containing protein n=1 Tax=Mytilus galloprovincialis TaxID=29158 RepID=A0A8B6CWY4_MYTGA|nr:Hypothetical predicted protein [Mytilus galloprovincialis]
MVDAVLEKSEKQNWTSVLYSLTLFAKGIERYVNDKIDVLHGTLRNQLHFITQNCVRSCSIHEPDLRNWCHTCLQWKTSILNHHKNRNVLAKQKFNWTCMDSAKWPIDPREFQKCFYPEWCFTTRTTPNLVDVSVLVGCMINCTEFNKNIDKVRKIRNEVSHNSTVSDNKRTRYCQTLLNFLQTPDVIQYQESQDAVTTITALQQTCLKDIIEQRLIKEQILHELEFKLFGKRTIIEHVKRHYKEIVSIFILLLSTCLVVWFVPEVREHEEHVNFTGRQWLFKGIKERIDDSNTKGLLIIAEPGFGKTAAMVEIISKRHNFTGYDMLYHLCRADTITFRDVSAFVLNIVHQLKHMYPAYKMDKDAIKYLQKSNVKNVTSMCTFDPIYCSHLLLIGPLFRIQPQPKRKLLILVDALDKCAIENKQSILSSLKQIYSLFPEWVKFLFTTRNDLEIASSFGNLKKWHLSKNSEEHKKDFVRHIQKLFSVQNYIAERLASETEYDFVLLQLARSLLTIKPKESNLNINNLPGSFQTAFELEMDFLYNNCYSKQFKNSRIIFEIIAASNEPLEQQKIFHIAQVADASLNDEYLFDELIHKMSPHVIYISASSQITFKTFLFKEWLTSKERKGRPYYVNIENGHKAIAGNLLDEILDNHEPDVSIDFITDLLFHINEANAKDLTNKIKLIPPYIVDRKTCFDQMNRTTCLSSLEVNAKCINSYTIMKLLLSISKSKNLTLAAINAVIANNTENVRAIVEHGMIDYSSQLEMFDMEDLIFDQQTDRYIEKYALTVLHFAISHGNIDVVKNIIKNDGSALNYRTRSGNSALQLAITKKNVAIFKLCAKHLNIQNEQNLLILSCLFEAYEILVYLFENGIKDHCVQCSKKNVVWKPDNKIYFEKYNTSVSVDEARISVDREPYNFITSEFLNLIIELTCESALHFAVRTRDVRAANIILDYNTATLECTDFQGLTAIARSVVFNQPIFLRKLLLSGAKTSFSCKPTDVKKRIKTMRDLNINNIFYMDHFQFLFKSDVYCPNGSSLGHLLTIHPSCTILSSLMATENLTNIFTKQNDDKQTPLYSLLCIDQFGRKQTKIKPDFLSAKPKLLILIIGLQDRRINRKKLIEDTVCGFKVQYTLYIDTSFKISPICSDSYNTFPKLEEIYIKHKSTLYNKNNVSMLLPLTRSSVLMIHNKSPGRNSQYLFSINVSL